MLLDTPLQVSATGGEENKLAVCAGLAKKQENLTLLVSNYRSAESKFSIQLRNLPWSGVSRVQIRRLDEKHDLTLEAAPEQIDHEAAGVVELAWSVAHPTISTPFLRASPHRPSLVVSDDATDNTQ